MFDLYFQVRWGNQLGGLSGLLQELPGRKPNQGLNLKAKPREAKAPWTLLPLTIVFMLVTISKYYGDVFNAPSTICILKQQMTNNLDGAALLEETLPLLTLPLCKIHPFANIQLCIAITVKPIVWFKKKMDLEYTGSRGEICQCLSSY